MSERPVLYTLYLWFEGVPASHPGGQWRVRWYDNHARMLGFLVQQMPYLYAYYILRSDSPHAVTGQDLPRLCEWHHLPIGTPNEDVQYRVR